MTDTLSAESDEGRKSISKHKSCRWVNATVEIRHAWHFSWIIGAEAEAAALIPFLRVLFNRKQRMLKYYFEQGRRGGELHLGQEFT